jgi:S-DNA-T family DNA segregation ATPase FtsK/SpoIIIE
VNNPQDDSEGEGMGALLPFRTDAASRPVDADDGRAADDAETLIVQPGQTLGPSVDRPGEVVPASARPARERRPILPNWACSRAGVVAVVAWRVKFGSYLVGYHGTRTPKYAAKVIVWAPVGAVRGTGRLVRWASAEDGNWDLRQVAAARGDADTWLKLDQRRERHARWRWIVLLGGGLPAGFLGTALVFSPALGDARWLVVVIVLVVLARLGRPIDKPITDRVTLGERFIKLTAEMTRAALLACGAGIKDPADVKFVADIGREHNGFMAQVALPPGVVATDVIDKRDRLAAGLRLPMDQVWPEQVKGEHPGRLNVYVADRPVSAMRQPRWPLLTEGTTDYFKTFSYGFDVRMRPVTWALNERNSLFGGIPGSGKSLAARDVLLGAVLDPIVIPVISELKGSGDFDMFEPLCPPGLYVSGADEGSIHATLAMVQWLYKQCEERPPLIAAYARQGLNDVKKLNRAMAEKDERLRPIVALFDEIQEAITDQTVGKQIAAMLTSIVKRGRALGIHLILATQRLDKASLPKGITSNVSNRAALAVPAQTETDMILGTSAYKTGARPTAFVPGEDSGWMVRVGFGPGFQTVRAAYIDDNAATAVCRRALQLRSGEPAGTPPVQIITRNLLRDVRQVWPAGEVSCWSETLVPRLRQLDGDNYADLTVETFGSLMKAAGVPTTSLHRKINGTGYTRAGIRLKALDAGLKIREHEHTP